MIREAEGPRQQDHPQNANDELSCQNLQAQQQEQHEQPGETGLESNAYGDDVGYKEQGSFRVLFQNINGIPKGNSNVKNVQMFDTVNQLYIDLSLIHI